MKYANNIEIEKASLGLLQQDKFLSANAISKHSKIDRGYLIRNGLTQPEDFIKLICNDKTLVDEETKKIFRLIESESSFENYMLSLFKYLTGWTCDWHRDSTIWSIEPTANNNLFLHQLRNSILFLAKLRLIPKFTAENLQTPPVKVDGVIAILSGVSELQWHVMRHGKDSTNEEQLCNLYLSACKAIKRTIGKKIKDFFPADIKRITYFIKLALKNYPEGFIFSKDVLNGIQVQSDKI